jgi:hypothetical protein
VHPDFLLKTGLKSGFGSVEPDLSVAKSNRAYAVSSDSAFKRGRGFGCSLCLLCFWVFVDRVQKHQKQTKTKTSPFCFGLGDGGLLHNRGSRRAHASHLRLRGAPLTKQAPAF